MMVRLNMLRSPGGLMSGTGQERCISMPDGCSCLIEKLIVKQTAGTSVGNCHTLRAIKSYIESVPPFLIWLVR